MPRKRQIDPGVWSSDDFTDLTLRQRLLFLGLISNADDYGRGKAHPGKLRSLIFPMDDIQLSDIAQDIETIAAEDRESVRLYQVGSSIYYELRNWKRHQKVDHPARSPIPSPQQGKPLASRLFRERLAKRSRMDRDPLAPSEESEEGRVGLGEEGEVISDPPSSEKASNSEDVPASSPDDDEPPPPHRVEDDTPAQPDRDLSFDSVGLLAHTHERFPDFVPDADDRAFAQEVLRRADLKQLLAAVDLVHARAPDAKPRSLRYFAAAFQEVIEAEPGYADYVRAQGQRDAAGRSP